MHLRLLSPTGGTENPSLKGESFNSSRGAQQMLIHKKMEFGRFYCIKTRFFRGEKIQNFLSGMAQMF